MKKKSRKYDQALKKMDLQRLYRIDDACELISNYHQVKFNQSVDAAVLLGVDPKQADQNIRSAVVLPHGTGKSVRIAVFAKGAKAKEAEEAGADWVGAEDLAQKIEDGFLEFNKVIATPDMMAVVGKLGKILGPRGLMPNPKIGTVTLQIAQAIADIKNGKIEIKVDKTGNVHAPIGRVSFSAQQIRENLKALMQAIQRVKPNSLKGLYIRKGNLSSTMGPGIRLDLGDLVSLTE